ncbi:hypothetical protein BX666DRAFT_823724 [Dichotomocladium elegans]|nr:hypothetical protein BX666DRAFT_823724 [Dichotomocladium elegans]
MVRQDLEAHIDDDGQEDTLTPPESETVLPSDRFTEDYDRSYPPHIRQVTDDHDRNDGGHHSHWAHRESTRRENGSGNAYNWREGHGRPIGSGSGSGSSAGTAGAYHREQEREREWRSRCERSAPWSNDQQTWVDRDRSRSKNRSERRSSNDKKLNFQPTVLKRPRRMSEQSARSDRSRDEHTVAHEPIASALDSLPEIPPTRPTELTAAQRKVMLSAAERAKKRRDEEEAEREAARERARQKALALAPLADKKPKESIEVKDDHNKGEGPTEAQQDLASHSIGSNDEPKAPVREKPEEVKPNVPEDAPTNTESMEDTPEKTNGRDIGICVVQPSLSKY